MQDDPISSSLSKSFKSFQSSMTGVERAYGEIRRQIETFQSPDIIPRNYLKELAGNLAHEIRNPLSGISNYVELLSKSDDSSRSHGISAILEGIDRIDKIVENLIVFSRPVELSRINCNFCDTVRSAVDCTRRDFKGPIDQVDFSVRLPETGVYAKVDPVLMLQALQNLLTNALEAMPKGGTTTIALVQNTHLKKLVLCIGDQGRGLPGNNCEKPFYPFYTTKTYGMGLGLPTTRLIIEKHGGKVWLKNSLEAGAVAIVNLPAN
jgi:two-component system sensor histidine kinase HydH